MKILNIAKDISCFLVVLIVFSCSARNVKTEKDVAYAQKLDSLMTKSYERGLFNGNVLVAKKGKIIYQKSFGFTDETRKIPLTKNAIFNFGSIVKQFNAVSIMMLHEQGLINYQDDVTQFFPEFPYKGITIKLLL